MVVGARARGTRRGRRRLVCARVGAQYGPASVALLRLVCSWGGAHFAKLDSTYIRIYFPRALPSPSPPYSGDTVLRPGVVKVVIFLGH